MELLVFIFIICITFYFTSKVEDEKPQIEKVAEIENRIKKPNPVQTIPSFTPRKPIKTVQDESISKPSLSSNQKDILQQIQNSRKSLILVTGRAGTGKSLLIEHIRSKYKGNVAILAPTGIAALNISGQTIHSFFKFPLRLINLQKDIKKSKNPAKFQALKILVIDECSMLRADLLDAIDHSLKRNRNSLEPFGGVKVLLVGDLYQLPPVVNSDSEKSLKEMGYKSQYFFSSFCVRKLCKNKNLHAYLLDDVFRQSDAVFIKILDEVRKSNLSLDNMNILDSRLLDESEDIHEDTVVLTTTNSSAEKINDRNLQKLPDLSRTYKAQIQGKFTSEFPAPEVLELKVGAKVIFLKNDASGRWVNGTIGLVERLETDVIHISIEGILHSVKTDIWEKFEYEVKDKEVIPHVVGSYKQFPLKLAWAITIHKSQGMTLDKVVLDTLKGAFEKGQVYVGLSRCKSLEGLKLRGAIGPEDLPDHTKVEDFRNYILEKELGEI